MQNQMRERMVASQVRDENDYGDTDMVMNTPGGGGQGDVPLVGKLLRPRWFSNVGGICEVREL